MPGYNVFLISHRDSLQSKLQEMKITVRSHLNASLHDRPSQPVTHLNLFMLSIQERAKLQISPKKETKGPKE